MDNKSKFTHDDLHKLHDMEDFIKEIETLKKDISVRGYEKIKRINRSSCKIIKEHDKKHKKGIQR